jgi:hypothetical protein
MKKIKEWIKNKLREFLGVEVIENNFGIHEKSNSMKFLDLHDRITLSNKELKKDISHFQESVNVLHNTVENVVHIGTDVYEQSNYGRSWAVICIEGKLNYVKFIDLGYKDARDIMYFLKQFEGGRQCIDTPRQEMFYSELFKF